MPNPPAWQSLDALVTGAEGLSLGLQNELKFYWESPPHFAPTRQIRLESAGLVPVPSTARTQQVPLISSTAEVHLLGDQLWADEQLHLSLTPEQATLTTAPEMHDQERLMLALTEIHRAGGWLPLHATVVAHDNNAVAIVGQSGAGKSTAALRLAGLGLAVLSEDRAWWHAASGLTTGLDRHFRAFDDSVERFAPTLWPQVAASPRDGKGKVMLPLPQQKPAVLKRVFMLRPQAAAPLTGPERVRAAWEATGIPLTDTAKAQTMRGLQQILPLLDAEVLTRENVVERVVKVLEEEN